VAINKHSDKKTICCIDFCTEWDEIPQPKGLALQRFLATQENPEISLIGRVRKVRCRRPQTLDSLDGLRRIWQLGRAMMAGSTRDEGQTFYWLRRATL
jgi:hypothetical protein